MVPAITQNIPEIVKAKAKAPVPCEGIIHDAHQEVRYLLILKTVLWIIPKTVLSDGYDLTTFGNAYLTVLNQFLDQLPAGSRLYNFFSMISLRSSAFNLSSAYIRLRRLFSSSSSFIRFSMGTHSSRRI